MLCLPTSSEQASFARPSMASKQEINNSILQISSLERTALPQISMPDIVPWIQANRTLNRVSSSETGAKKISRTPFFVAILEDFLNENIKEIVVMKSAQIGLTDLCVDYIGYLGLHDPCPIAYFLADEKTTKKIYRDRVQSFFSTCVDLRKLKYHNKRDQNTELYLKNGFNLTMTYASSIAQTASKSYRIVIMDELDKPGYQIMKDEGSTLGRIKERTDTYEDYKIIKFGTPTTDNGLIYKELQKCDAVYEWFVPCPYCGEFQPLRFKKELYKAESVEFTSGEIVWEGSVNAKPQEIEDTTRYMCGFCEKKWTTYEKNTAVEQGKMVAQQKITSKIVKKGYYLWRGHSCLAGGNLARIVQSFIDCKGDPSELQNFTNSAIGKPWVQKISKITDKDFELLKKPIAQGMVPDDTLCLVCGIDSQINGVWYVVRAFNRAGGSVVIDFGFLESVDNDDSALDYLLFEKEYEGMDGKHWKIWRALRDVGGGMDKDTKTSITEKVMIWLRNNKDRDCQLYGCRGANMPMEIRVKLSKPIDTTPSGKALKGSIQIARIDTGKIKDAFYYRLDLAKRGEPGGAYVNQDISDKWYRHITAEEKRIVRGKEKWVQIREDNHGLDCEVYCHAAVEKCFLGGIAILKNPVHIWSRRKRLKTSAAAEVKSVTNNEPVIAVVGANDRLMNSALEKNPYLGRR